MGSDSKVETSAAIYERGRDPRRAVIVWVLVGVILCLGLYLIWIIHKQEASDRRADVGVERGVEGADQLKRISIEHDALREAGYDKVKLLAILDGCAKEGCMDEQAVKDRLLRIDAEQKLLDGASYDKEKLRAYLKGCSPSCVFQREAEERLASINTEPNYWETQNAFEKEKISSGNRLVDWFTETLGGSNMPLLSMTFMIHQVMTSVNRSKTLILLGAELRVGTTRIAKSILMIDGRDRVILSRH
jgi:hypothetical protein